MLTRHNLILLVCLPFFAVACGGPAGTGEGADAGATSTGSGTGSTLDAGSAVDRGMILVDAGLTNTPDAGRPKDPFDGGVRFAAAKTTAETAALCTAIGSFYWEVGDSVGALASGSVTGTGGGAKNYSGDTSMSIASASKWFYSTYFVERTQGVLSANDIKFLNFWSGYTNFTQCGQAANTVADCLGGNSGTLDPATENKFDYGGGHMQKHAELNGLGAYTNATLAAEILSKVGTELEFSYNTPQPAGGGKTSAFSYAKLLRKIISGQLVMKSVLGTHPVCTDPTTCNLTVSTPSPKGEQWHYSIGHWVEDDPTVGDGAFSSPGAFGFYPWIDSTKTLYGIVARDALGGAISSVKCGRLIRKAFVTGVAQL